MVHALYARKRHDEYRLHEPIGHRGQSAPVQIQTEGLDFLDDPQKSVQIRIALLFHPRQGGVDVDTVHAEL